jgi:RNA polymerase sigma factor (sigma-70 family)
LRDSGQFSTQASFVNLIEDVRNGDQAAASRLVAQFEPQILRFIRFRLSDPLLRRVVDSLDLCQCVLLKLFDRLSRGEWSMSHPSQLVRLLQTMARNELIDQRRRQHARPRIVNGNAPGRSSRSSSPDHWPGSSPSPSEIAAGNELWQGIHCRLNPQERELMDLRLMQGMEWNEISENAGEQPDALRKRLARGIDRAARELGLVTNAEGLHD